MWIYNLRLIRGKERGTCCIYDYEVEIRFKKRVKKIRTIKGVKNIGI